MHPCNLSLTHRLPCRRRPFSLRLSVLQPALPFRSLALQLPPSSQFSSALPRPPLHLRSPPFLSGGELPSSAASMSDLVLRRMDCLKIGLLVRALGEASLLHQEALATSSPHTCSAPCYVLRPLPCKITCLIGIPGRLSAMHCPPFLMIRLRAPFPTGWPPA